MRRIAAIVCATLCPVTVAVAATSGIQRLDSGVKFEEVGTQKIIGEKNISAIALRGDWLVIGSDETLAVQILHREADDHYTLKREPFALEQDPGDGKHHEIDIEGIAR